MAALKSVPREVPAASSGGGGTPGGAEAMARYVNDLTARAREKGFDPAQNLVVKLNNDNLKVHA